MKAYENSKFCYLYQILIFAFFTCATFELPAKKMEDYAEAINKAGRQRMLSQRITRAYCQIGLKVDSVKAESLLNEAMDLFSSQFNLLSSFSDTDEYKEAITSVDSIWKSYSMLVMTEPQKADVVKVIQLDEQLLSASDRVVQILVRQSGSRVAKLVNISGRQRMLSQRLAKLYLLKSWGIEDHQIDTEIERSMNEFSGAMELLINSTENNLLINQYLEKAKTQWIWFSSTLSMSDNQFFPLIVIDSSERLLNLMEKITGMYQQLSDESDKVGSAQRNKPKLELYSVLH